MEDSVCPCLSGAICRRSGNGQREPLCSRITVESVRSRWRRETGSFADICSKIALAMPRLPSEFSKSMGWPCAASWMSGFCHFHLLFEIIHRNGRPRYHGQDRSEWCWSASGCRKRRHVVVMFYLRGCLAALQTQRFIDEFIGELLPQSDAGISNMMRIEFPVAPPNLAEMGIVSSKANCIPRAFCKYIKFLANRGGWGRLAMGAGKHGNVVPFLWTYQQVSVDSYQARALKCLRYASRIARGKAVLLSVLWR